MQVKFISQSEQAGGYWLIQCKLADAKQLPIGTELLINENRAVLFSQNALQASFLSLQPAKTEFLTQNLPTDPHPWRFLPLDTSLLTPKQPIILFASDLDMASAFYTVSQLKEKQSFIVILHATENFPFVVKPARYMLDNFPAEGIGACPLLEDWKQLNRLCSSQSLPGCFDGDLAELKKHWQPPKGLTTWDLTRNNNEPT